MHYSTDQGFPFPLRGTLSVQTEVWQRLSVHTKCHSSPTMPNKWHTVNPSYMAQRPIWRDLNESRGRVVRIWDLHSSNL
jgi:hypothetical protein